MVVERCQINGRKRAAFKTLCPGLRGQQFRERKAATLGLQQPLAVDLARLADRAVDGAGDSLEVGSDGASAGLQRPRKKLIEAAKAQRIALCGLRHVDRVELEKAAH